MLSSPKLGRWLYSYPVPGMPHMRVSGYECGDTIAVRLEVQDHTAHWSGVFSGDLGGMTRVVASLCQGVARGEKEERERGN